MLPSKGGIPPSDTATGKNRRKPRASPLHSPREIVDLVLGYSGAALERMLGKPPPYETVVWEGAVLDMEARFGRTVVEILHEPALAEVEGTVRRMLRSIIREDDPRGRQWAVDSMLARFCYLVCRLLEPEVVLETGVAYGASSAFVLKALEENGRGMLYSVDMPPLRGNSRRLWGVMVEERFEGRWSLHRGASRRVLPGLLNEVGPVDVFLHDSLHTRWNMRREFETVWPCLRTGGILIADDVERNQEFDALERWKPAYRRVVSDMERWPLSGTIAPVTFGIAIK